MNWVVEQPIAILFIGAFCTAVSAAIWLQLRSRAAAIALGVCALGTFVWLTVERLVVTHAEEVEQCVHEIAWTLQSDDPSAVERYLQLSDPQQSRQVDQALNRVRIEAITIKRNLTVQVVQRSDGTLAAEARFNAVARVRPERGPDDARTVPRFVILRLRRAASGWVVTHYELRTPIG